MYVNTGNEITNTPTNITAAYNTWQYNVPRGDEYQHVPRKYVDHEGKIREWKSWDPPKLMAIPGGQYKGTPTRTGAFYVQNVVIDPRHIPNTSGECYYGGQY